MLNIQNAAAAGSGVEDEEIVRRVRAGETALYELIVRRYNQRLYRVARSITGDESEAEDIMQEAYMRAFEHLDQFEGRSSFATWLTKIAVYEALSRRNRRARFAEAGGSPAGESAAERVAAPDPDPERRAIHEELRRGVETAVEALPEKYRSVFVLREIEQMSTAEVAESLGINAISVKVRLHRARALLRAYFESQFGGAAEEVFAFHRRRCDRVTSAVMARIL